MSDRVTKIAPRGPIRLGLEAPTQPVSPSTWPMRGRRQNLAAGVGNDRLGLGLPAGADQHPGFKAPPGLKGELASTWLLVAARPELPTAARTPHRVRPAGPDASPPLQGPTRLDRCRAGWASTNAPHPSEAHCWVLALPVEVRLALAPTDPPAPDSGRPADRRALRVRACQAPSLPSVPRGTPARSGGVRGPVHVQAGSRVRRLARVSAELAGTRPGAVRLRTS